jgi:hypothetical protein
MNPRSSPLVGSTNVGLEDLPFAFGEVGRVALFHAQERTSSTHPSRFSKQFRSMFSRKFGVAFSWFVSGLSWN